MDIFLNIALMVLSISMIALILMQTRGGGLGGAFGGDSVGGAGQYKTRRGLEKTLFQTTIGISALFFIVVIITVFVF